MNNRQIQEERIKGYFLDAAKHLLRTKGLQGVSVRSVASLAGYSYATLYNYFKDIKELLFRCVEDFCREAEAFVQERSRGAEGGQGRLRATARAYAEYLAGHPGVFELFFLERLGELESRVETAGRITGLLDGLCAASLEACVAEGSYDPAEAAAVMEELRYALPGMLLLYHNRLAPREEEAFLNALDRELDRIFR